MPPPPGSTPTCSSRRTWRSRSCSPPTSTGPRLVGVDGNYDDVNRLCTELAAERGWAFVNVNLRPYYAEGSKTLAYETVEQLGWRAAGQDRLPDRLRVAVHEDRPRLRRMARARPRRGRPARLPRRPGRRLRPGRDRVRGRPGGLPPGPPGHDRQEPGDRQPRRRSLRARPRPATGGSIESVSDDEIRAGIRLLAETTGIFTETAGGVTTATLAKLAESGELGRRRAGRRLHHRRGPEDPRCGAGGLLDARDRADAGLVRRARPGPPGGHGLAARLSSMKPSNGASRNGSKGEDPRAAATRDRG